MTIRPALVSREESGGQEAGYRFRISVVQLAWTDPAVRVFDRRDGAALFEWTGAAARRLLARPLLPPTRSCAVFECDQAFARRLALEAAAAALVPAGPAASTTPATDRHPTYHEHLLSRLRASGEQHFNRRDLVSLVVADCPALDAARVDILLDEFVRRRQLRRIAVDNDNVFYDLDTTAHLHVFDPVTGVLMDAPDDGVVIIAAGQPPDIAPTIRNGSLPSATASGSSASGRSSERSLPSP